MRRAAIKASAISSHRAVKRRAALSAAHSSTSRGRYSNQKAGMAGIGITSARGSQIGIEMACQHGIVRAEIWAAILNDKSLDAVSARRWYIAWRLTLSGISAENSDDV